MHIGFARFALLLHASCVPAKALKLAVGDATETTVAAVKSAASFESDCDTVHMTHLVERGVLPDRVWMWSYIVRRRQLLWRTTDNSGNQLCHRITCVSCGYSGFILVETTWPHPAADIGNTLGFKFSPVLRVTTVAKIVNLLSKYSFFQTPKHEKFSASGGAPLTPHQGLCPWTPLGAQPPDPHYRFALRAHRVLAPPQTEKPNFAYGHCNLLDPFSLMQCVLKSVVNAEHVPNMFIMEFM